MKIIALVLLLLVSGCTVSLFKYNPLNGCSPRPVGVTCPPNREAEQEYDFEYKKITSSNTN